MNTDLESLFKYAVTEEFDFLVKDYGYSVFQDNPWRYSYIRGSIKLVMEFDGASFGCWIEREDLDLADTYRAIGVEVISKCLGYQASNEVRFRPRDEILLNKVKTNSILIKKYCLNFIKGDFSKWDIVIECLKNQDKTQKEKNEAETLGYHLRDIRQMANFAWMNKDFKQVIYYYKSIENSLSKLEKKRLEYAEKQINN